MEKTMNKEVNKSKCTIKKVLRILSVLSLIFFFCPSFLVSCGGGADSVPIFSISLSGVRAVSLQYIFMLIKQDGISELLSDIRELSFGDIICFYEIKMMLIVILPIIIVVLSFIKKIKKNIYATVVMIISVIEIIYCYIIRYNFMKDNTENIYIEPTFWFYVNLIAIVLIIVFSIIRLIKKDKVCTENDVSEETLSPNS